MNYLNLNPFNWFTSQTPEELILKLLNEEKELIEEINDFTLVEQNTSSKRPPKLECDLKTHYCSKYPKCRDDDYDGPYCECVVNRKGCYKEFEWDNTSEFIFDDFCLGCLYYHFLQSRNNFEEKYFPKISEALRKYLIEQLNAGNFTVKSEQTGLYPFQFSPLFSFDNFRQFADRLKNEKEALGILVRDLTHHLHVIHYFNESNKRLYKPNEEDKMCVIQKLKYLVQLGAPTDVVLKSQDDEYVNLIESFDTFFSDGEGGIFKGQIEEFRKIMPDKTN